MEPAVETADLTKTYGSLIAVNALNLTVETGTIHGFLGPNGAGKTTTIKMFTGLLKPDGGSAKLLGYQLGWDNPHIRARVGYMPELPKLPKHLKGHELLDLYGRMYGMAKDRRDEQIPKLLDLVSLKGRETDLIGKYSKGMQQRLGLAQALLNEPQLVILDEPSLGLDPVGMVEVRDTIKELVGQGITVFLSSHLLHEVEQVCTHVTIINKGVAIVSGTIKQIAARLTGALAIEVEVDKLSDAVIANVKRLPVVKDVSREGQKLLIGLKTRDDARSEVSQAIAAAGGIVIAMHLRGESLEDIFLNLLSKTQTERV
jgi:ABC-2 type transport system ATP-binding protein